MGVNPEELIKPLGSYIAMSLLIMAVPFFFAKFNAAYIAAPMLAAFAILVAVGFFKKASKWNSLAVVPALYFSLGYAFYSLSSWTPSAIWGIVFIALWVGCCAVFCWKRPST